VGYKGVTDGWKIFYTHQDDDSSLKPGEEIPSHTRPSFGGIFMSGNNGHLGSTSPMSDRNTYTARNGNSTSNAGNEFDINTMKKKGFQLLPPLPKRKGSP
jgi:hypothetical protein